jgi:ferredoxin
MNNKYIFSACRRYITSEIKNNTEVRGITTKTDDDAFPMPDVRLPIKWRPKVDFSTDVVDLFC